MKQHLSIRYAKEMNEQHKLRVSEELKNIN